MRRPVLSTLFSRRSSKRRHRPTGGALRSRRFLSFLERFLSFPRRFALLPFALLMSRLARCRLGSSIKNGCCHLGAELDASVSGNARSAATSQPPEPGVGLLHKLF